MTFLQLSESQQQYLTDQLDHQIDACAKENHITKYEYPDIVEYMLFFREYHHSYRIENNLPVPNNPDTERPSYNIHFKKDKWGNNHAVLSINGEDIIND